MGEVEEADILQCELKNVVLYVVLVHTVLEYSTVLTACTSTLVCVV